LNAVFTQSAEASTEQSLGPNSWMSQQGGFGVNWKVSARISKCIECLLTLHHKMEMNFARASPFVLEQTFDVLSPQQGAHFALQQ
jgi:hypothetical protein